MRESQRDPASALPRILYAPLVLGHRYSLASMVVEDELKVRYYGTRITTDTQRSCHFDTALSHRFPYCLFIN